MILAFENWLKNYPKNVFYFLSKLLNKLPSCRYSKMFITYFTNATIKLVYPAQKKTSDLLGNGVSAN